jgi:PTH1 family peptidyl-tRNA hydrolase
MYLVGLGNKDPFYHNTRHNVGKDFIQYCLNGQKMEQNSNILKAKMDPYEMLIPICDINLSGQYLKQYISKNNIQLNSLLIIYDDIQINYGYIQFRGQGSARGHNALRNIEEIFGTNQYKRIGIGIGPKSSLLSNYVLSKHTEEQRDQIENIFIWMKENLSFLLSLTSTTLIKKI